MLLQLQGYDIELVYRKGTEMYIADALSRAFPPTIVIDDFEREIAEEKSVHLMSSTAYVTDRKVEEIKEHMKSDERVQLLIKQIKQGWPSDKRFISSEIKEYYQHKEKLTELDGLVYADHAILIPPTLQKDTLGKLHRSHQGIEKKKQLARQTVFWPGMSKQIEDTVSSCPTCQRYRNANTKEPLHPHELPQRPWQRLATDLFEYKKRPHLVLVDYYSRYPEVAELRDMKSKTVISKMKSFFSRHGIPDEVVSDNGPNYASQEFKEFASAYGFRHTTTNPRYPQSGGLHEKTVQTVKAMLKKVEESGGDVYLALLDYRNTLIGGVSPAQAVMNRSLKSTIPATPKNLKLVLTDHNSFIDRRKAQQQKQCEYYNRSAHALQPLREKEEIRMRKTPDSDWQPATVIGKHDTPRSYIVATEDGTTYRRNRKHLLKLPKHEQPDLEIETDSYSLDKPGTSLDKPENTEQITNAQEQPVPPLRVSSFGRVIKHNPKYT